MILIAHLIQHRNNGILVQISLSDEAAAIGSKTQSCRSPCILKCHIHAWIECKIFSIHGDPFVEWLKFVRSIIRFCLRLFFSLIWIIHCLWFSMVWSNCGYCLHWEVILLRFAVFKLTNLWLVWWDCRQHKVLFMSSLCWLKMNWRWFGWRLHSLHTLVLNRYLIDILYNLLDL